MRKTNRSGRCRVLVLAIILALTAGVAAYRFRVEIQRFRSVYVSIPLPDANGIVAPLPAAPHPPASPPVDSVLMITFDSARADRFGIYGYPRDTSPCINSFARRSIVFSRAYSAGTWTGPALTALLTGVLPRYSGGCTMTSPLPDEIERPVHYFTGAGIRTAFFIAHGLCRLGSTAGADERICRPEATARDVTDWAIDWLETHGNERFFLWLHYFEPHLPYLLPEGREPLRLSVEDETASRWKQCPAVARIDPLADYHFPLLDGRVDTVYYARRYDRRIKYLDRHVGRLLSYVEGTPWFPMCAVVLSSDHGESLGEHGIFGHGGTPYEELARVPLVIRLGSDRTGKLRAIREPVSHIDLMPTICDLLGVTGPATMQGQSLRPLWENGTWRRRALITDACLPGEQYAVAVRAGDHKLYYGEPVPNFTLHANTADDPCESGLHFATPLDYARYPGLLDLYRQVRRYALLPGVSTPIDPDEGSDASLERLRELGYIVP